MFLVNSSLEGCLLDGTFATRDDVVIQCRVFGQLASGTVPTGAIPGIRVQVTRHNEMATGR